MRLHYVFLIIMLVINIAVDGYIYMALHSYLRRKIWKRIHLASSVLLFILPLCVMALPLQSGGDGVFGVAMWMLFTYLGIYFAKYVFVLFDILSRLPLLFRRKRCKSMTIIGAILGGLLLALMWWGALFNRYNEEVTRVDITGSDVPAALDGFTIVQISDLHLGSYYGDTTFISKVVDRINLLKPDLVVFTGDIVNRVATEVEPFEPVLSRLKARYGVYSILGNHDYGDYFEWESSKAKEANLAYLEAIQHRMGWQLLKNRTVVLPVNGEKVMLIGVENVGEPPFNTYGDLRKAYSTTEDSHFKILLSHNPSHYDMEIQDNPEMNVALTLSGHTHAMQTELFGWSPCVFRYKHWGGLYTDSLSHRLYVNIGLGTVGYPARIGANPEITLFTLHHSR